MLKGMAGSVLGVWVAHGEGRLSFPKDSIMSEMFRKRLAAVAVVDDKGRTDRSTPESYQFNHDGSPYGARRSRGG